MKKTRKPTKAELEAQLADAEEALDEIADLALDEEKDPKALLDEIADLALPEEDEDECEEEEPGEEEPDSDEGDEQQ